MSYFWGFISALGIIFILNAWVGYRDYQFKKEIIDTAKAVANQVIALRWERVNDVVYSYNRLNDEFVAQGSTFKEWRANFEARFKDKQVVFDLEFMDSFKKASK